MAVGIVPPLAACTFEAACIAQNAERLGFDFIERYSAACQGRHTNIHRKSTKRKRSGTVFLHGKNHPV